jgi:hypothetical protein
VAFVTVAAKSMGDVKNGLGARFLMAFGAIGGEFGVVHRRLFELAVGDAGFGRHITAEQAKRQQD